jgi:hypothetical protein
MAPFYPIEAEKKKVPPIYTGYIMGTMAIVSMISSFITGKTMHKKGS